MIVTNQELSVSADCEVRLTLTVAGSSVTECYDKTIAELRRTTHVKGFRRGKAPRDVLARKFGRALTQTVTRQVINDAVNQVLAEVEQKPLPIVSPRADSDAEIVPGQDFTFTVLYDTYPDVKLGPYRDLDLEKPQVTIDDADLERELSRLQERNALVIDKKADGDDAVVVEHGDVVTVNWVELDDAGAPAVATERRDFVFEVGTGYNIYHMDDELIGMARGSEKEFSKSFPADYEYRELANRIVTLKVTVTSIKEKQLPDIDDELAQDISDSFETLEDLKNDLRKGLQEDADRRVRGGLIDQLMEKVVESSVVPLPKSMITAGMQREWRSFSARSGRTEEQIAADLAANGQDVARALEMLRPMVERRTRFSLVCDRLAREEQIEISDDDLDAYFREQAERRGVDAAELRERYESDNALDYVRGELRNEKLFDNLIAGSNVKAGARTSYVDLAPANQVN